jgi:hypothetical protein
MDCLWFCLPGTQQGRQILEKEGQKVKPYYKTDAACGPGEASGRSAAAGGAWGRKGVQEQACV